MIPYQCNITDRGLVTLSGNSCADKHMVTLPSNFNVHMLSFGLQWYAENVSFCGWLIVHADAI